MQSEELSPSESVRVSFLALSLAFSPLDDLIISIAFHVHAIFRQVLPLFPALPAKHTTI
jgi:hypothetical protein